MSLSEGTESVDFSIEATQRLGILTAEFRRRLHTATLDLAQHLPELRTVEPELVELALAKVCAESAVEFERGVSKNLDGSDGGRDAA